MILGDNGFMIDLLDIKLSLLQYSRRYTIQFVYANSKDVGGIVLCA
jgi:hypothetical protein